jgi:eukaryotic-like serine/threonine-protein kinase
LTIGRIQDDLLGAKYRLLHRLADGAMGEVWQARDEALGRQVAVKLLHPRGEASEVERTYLKRRLSREAQITSTVRHRAVVRALDVGTTSADEPYMVMEFLRGKPLDRILDRRRSIPAARAVELMLPVADGLATLHAIGVVHRDIKPENIFVAWEPVRQICPKLIDFGVAKLLDPFRRESLTGSGLIGTPGYMAPEQALDSSAVDGRADVWSFCVVLYEMLCGRVPFAGQTSADVLRAVLEQDVPPPPEDLRVDSALWTVIERGLERQREKRWERMRPLASALGAWLDDQPKRE